MSPVISWSADALLSIMLFTPVLIVILCEEYSSTNIRGNFLFCSILDITPKGVNTLVNALKYSPNQTRIVIKTIRTNESIQIHVQAQGIGLDNVDIKLSLIHIWQSHH